MSEKEIKKQLIEKISIMEGNRFLLPNAWSDKIDMVDHTWSYRTYNNGSTGSLRYHNIEIFEDNKTILTILIRGEDISVPYIIGKKRVKPIDIFNYIDAIFKEKHSFDNHNEGKRKIRKSINELKARLISLQKDIKDKEIELEDFNKLNK